MSIIDLETLLQAVSEQQPCGEDLEAQYDPLFQALEQAAQGEPERQMGAEVVPAKEPNWPDVKAKSLELLARSKDIRACVYLIQALLNTDGWPGFSAGLVLLEQLLQRYWDGVHPQLDPDDNDATFRLNALMTLHQPDGMNFTNGILSSLCKIPLVESRGFGRFSQRDIDIAGGKMTSTTSDAEQLPQLSTINAAFEDVDAQILQATAVALHDALASAKRVAAVLQDKLAEKAPDFSALLSELGDLQKTLAERLAARGLTPVAEDADRIDEAPSAGPSNPATAQALSGEINSRDDVAQMLDKICDYFRHHEPGSPVPLLLQRAKRLVASDFMGILQDLAPDAVTQAQNVLGVQSSAEQDD